MSYRLCCIFFLACILRFAAEPARAQQGAPASQTPALAQRDTISADYKIGNGDVLQISVWGEHQLTRSVTVRPDGKISLPLIDELEVAGTTTPQLQEELNQRFAAYIRHPQAAVLVAEIHSKLVYVTGEVQRPGAYPVASTITVVQLIARAGGTTEFAKQSKMYVLRQSNGKRLNVNYKAVIQGRRESENVELLPGDTVVVP